MCNEGVKVNAKAAKVWRRWWKILVMVTTEVDRSSRERVSGDNLVQGLWWV